MNTDQKPGRNVISGGKNLANPPSMAQLSGVKTEGTHQQQNAIQDTIEESEQIKVENSAEGSNKKGGKAKYTYEKLGSPNDEINDEQIDDDYADPSYSGVD